MSTASSLVAQVEATPDMTMPKLAARLVQTTGTRAAPAVLSRFLCRLGFTYIKKPLMASQCARVDIAEQRNLWITRRQPLMRLEPHWLVFIDETAINTKMIRLRGRSLRGKRLPASAPFGHWRTQSFIVGLRCHVSIRRGPREFSFRSRADRQSDP
ncbi:hypothetical protein SAMN05428997_13824 [Bosea sp. CRIB-10]|uniref:hypothetical protein n=1 Tax=Bosea sp. CRIB-10 TaxID=378404 RepID=UPI0008DF0B4D|nr:hypothetical protein [Bosea sp. CRIB-10]SFD64603.1 hypothetical protein SAMN05428997_13824 [Bosea sp. CRIB-10]